MDLSTFTTWTSQHPIITSLVSVILGIFAYYFLIFFQHTWKLRHFRGPFAIPILGNCYNPNVVTQLFRFLVNCRKTYGKTFVVYIFQKCFLVILDPSIARRILSDSRTFIKGHNYTEKFSILFGEGLVTAEADKHRKDRAIFMKYFIRSNVVKEMDNINVKCLQAMDEFLYPEFDGKNTLSTNVEHFFARLTLRVFMNFAVNYDYSHDLKREQEICDLVSKSSYYIGVIIAFSVPKIRGLSLIDTIEKCRREIWNDAKVKLEERKRKIQSGELTDKEKDDCMTAMIENNMSEKDVTDHIVTLISAGHDTTAYFAAYVCLCLADNPECQVKLRNDIMRQMGDREHVTTDDIAELKYLTYFLHETLRVFAIIPNVSRVTDHDVVIKECNDLFIPKGTEILVPMYLINRDPDIWENPSKFDPMRWEGRGEYTSAKDGFFPFGYGTRTCIGNLLAQLEVSVFITQILRRFEILPEPGFKVKINGGISLTTSNGVRVILKKL